MEIFFLVDDGDLTFEEINHTEMVSITISLNITIGDTYVIYRFKLGM